MDKYFDIMSNVIVTLIAILLAFIVFGICAYIVLELATR